MKQSTTDSGSGYIVRDGKLKDFFYLDYRTVDGQCNIITDVHLTPVMSTTASLIWGVWINRRSGSASRRALARDRNRQIYGVTGYRRPPRRNGYRHYHTDPDRCLSCPRIPATRKGKTLMRLVWEDSKGRIGQHRLSPGGQLIYQRRKEVVERSFTDAKELVMLGSVDWNERKVSVYWRAAAQNIKRSYYSRPDLGVIP